MSPIYEFQHDDGRLSSHYFLLNDRPELDSRVELPDGSWGRRIISVGQRPAVKDVEHVDHQHHRDYHFNDDERCLKGPDGKRAYPRVNEKGQPVWRNKREIDEASARMGWTFGDVDGPA